MSKNTVFYRSDWVSGQLEANKNTCFLDRIGFRVQKTPCFLDRIGLQDKMVATWPNMSQLRPTWGQLGGNLGPTWAPGTLKIVLPLQREHDFAKTRCWLPRAAQEAPRDAQEAPRAGQEGPGVAQERPRGAQERPREPQEPPRRPQETAKSGQESQHRPNLGPLGPTSTQLGANSSQQTVKDAIRNHSSKSLSRPLQARCA